MSILLVDSTAEECQRFFEEEWEPYNRAQGITWSVGSIHLVARGEGRILGAAAGSVGGGVGELKQILVVQRAGGQGVGSRLLTTFESRCRAMGCHQLRLETAEYQARGFYERHGFVVLHTLEDDRFHRRWYVMGKRLGD